jgi:hypothetical protein
MRPRWNIVMIALAWPAIASGAAPATGDRFGLVCSGIETLQYGTQAPQRVVHGITLSVDLAGKRYCYATCARGQTYAIVDPASSPIKLADFDAGGQVRHMLYDRAAARLTDDQKITMGPILVIRHAADTCQAGPYTQPPAG